MRVRSLIALSFFAACAAIAADNTPRVVPVKPVQDNLSIRKLFASDRRLLRMAVVRKYWMRPLRPAQPYLGPLHMINSCGPNSMILLATAFCGPQTCEYPVP